MTSPHQPTWNHGVPPPPPPPRPPGSIPFYPPQGDVGNVCPPPPPFHQIPGHQTSQQYPSNCTPMQPKTHPQMHQPTAMGYPHNIVFAHQNGQQFFPMFGQYPQRPPNQYQPQQNYQQFQQYTNYSFPPPPPPPQQHNNNQGHHSSRSHRGKANSNGNWKNKKDFQGNPSDANSEVAASLRRSLGANNINHNQKSVNHGNNMKNNPDESIKKSKINPKMAKKYSGRGLKTITVSGPGLPPQTFKICVGNHPDDVKKWIEERKKRFPRRSANCDVSNKISMKTDSRKRGREDGEATKLSPINHSMNKKQCESKEDDDEKNGGNLSSLLAGYESSSSKEDDSKPGEQIATAEESNHTGKIISPEDITASNAFVSTDMLKSSTSGKQKVCKFYQRGNCRHGSSCKFLHSDEASHNHVSYAASQTLAHRKTQSERDRARIQRERELQKLGLANPSHGTRGGAGKFINNTSLLNKLLNRDMERERSLTLQMLRYIVDNNFFQGAVASERDGLEGSESKIDSIKYVDRDLTHPDRGI